MDILQGALAFAVAMILFATVVSGVSEWALRTINRRPKTIARMVGIFVDREISRRLRREIVSRNPKAFGVTSGTPLGSDEKWGKFTDNLVALLTRNPVAERFVDLPAFGGPGAAEAPDKQDERGPAVLTPALPAANEAAKTSPGMGVDRLTTYGFLQRLAKTEVGRAIIRDVRASPPQKPDQAPTSAQETANSAQDDFKPQDLTQEDHDAQRALLQDIARTYERYTAAANEAYRKRGRAVAMVYAIIIALVFNISAWRLFSHLVDSPETREDLLARVEQTVADNESADERLTALVRALEEPDAAKRIEELRAIDPNFDTEDVEELVAQLKSELDPLLNATTLPIGPGYFPYACFSFGPPIGTADDGKWLRTDLSALPACSVFAPVDDGVPPWVPSLGLWIANVFLAGILIGLGGPFWYRVFSSLSHLTQLLRMLNGGGHSEVMKTNAPDQPATQSAFKEATAKADGGREDGDIVTVFYTAAGQTPPKIVNGQIDQNGGTATAE